MGVSVQRIVVGLALGLGGCPAGDGGGDDSFGEAGTAQPETGTSGSTGAMPSTTEMPATESTGSESCAGSCLDIPAGWFGPVVVARGAVDAPAPDCGGGYTEAGFTLLEGFVEPEPTICSCDCAVAPFGACKMGIVTYPGAECVGIGQTIEVMNACVAADVNGVVEFGLGDGDSTTCSREVSEEIPDSSWQTSVATCRASEEATVGCDVGTCVPAAPPGFETSACIFAEGDAACPEGEFSEAFPLFSGVDDDRFCSTCQCGEQAFDCTSSDGSFIAYSEAGCEGDVIVEGDATVCTPVANAVSFGFSFAADLGCPVGTPPEPQGAATPTGPFTYCCQPPSG